MTDRLDADQPMELLRQGTQYLAQCGVADARVEADLILAFVLKTTRDKLYAERDRVIASPEKEIYNDFLKRRGQREPLAYLLKTREFMGLDFFVNPSVLIPRPETELLVEKVLELGKNIGREREHKEVSTRVLDLCTGSGAIAVAVAYYWNQASVVAVDMSFEALTVAKINAAKMNVNIDFRLGDLFAPVQGEKFSLIVSNPPYISEQEILECPPEVRKEPVLALLAGKDGLDFYRRIAMKATEFLNHGGIILVEIGYSQGTQVRELFKAAGYQTELFSDYAGLDRIVLARKE
ncbi:MULTISPECIES: peptide chain release factor N(5)-glutamine methyltransferase [unclassified Dehalobacter]|uniref:peptide chain release factor N(5)-glutamine methyltransferase n=1 Tax=unclassified Dehalobacter TaxID=2635733 RepID=UPI0003687F66|nr:MULTISPECIES: peptide chain release factor N(5)-glutamine methyltransferase [unclassified Dehalobacter]RJE47430.1 protein-(glutamine-N5) methyltransferase, release factor-specific [Dehalobacter sp. MCB1]TCX48760.1 peptide chain release factor N(5)-glutamine methyltransferase [Dehalobacter sp. 14DCB1]TCX56192.1 peptide chain release factor N(5)-glutamine methyltransferase [Dehalobacter sp. 12DCB1]